MTLPKVATDRLRQLKKIQKQDERIRKAFGPNRKIEEAIDFCRNYLEFNNFQLVPSVILNPKDVEIDYDEVYELFSYPDDFKEGELHPNWKKQLEFCQTFLLECGYKEIVDTTPIQWPVPVRNDINTPTTTSNKVKYDDQYSVKTLIIPADSDMMTISVGSTSQVQYPETLQYNYKIDVTYMDDATKKEMKTRCLRQAVECLMEEIKKNLEKYVEIKQEFATHIGGEFVYTNVKIKVTPIK